MKLIDVVENLSMYSADLTIYAKEPWTCDSDALVAREPDSGELPSDASEIQASYFIEVFIANEFLEGWRQRERPMATLEEQCERLIQYAMNDA